MKRRILKLFQMFDTGFHKVNAGFLLVILIAMMGAASSIVLIRKNMTILASFNDKVIPYMESLEKLKLLITESKMLATNWVYLQNSNNDKARLIRLHIVDYPALKEEIRKNLSRIDITNAGDSITALFATFEEVLKVEQNIMTELQSFDDYENPLKKFYSEDLVESVIIPETGKLQNSLGEIISKAREETGKMKSDMHNTLLFLSSTIIIISLFLLAGIIFATAFMISIIKRPILQLKGILHQMGRGILPEDSLKPSEDIVGEMIDAVNRLRLSFGKTTQFAHEIEKGNFDAEFELLSEQDNLGNALLGMKNSLVAYSRDMEGKVRERSHEIAMKNIELEKLSIVASGIDNSVIIANAEGLLEWFNPSLEKRLGMTVEEFKKKNGETLINGSRNPEFRNIFNKSVETGKPVTYETEYVDWNGQEAIMKSTLTPIFNEQGELQKIVVIDTDISELKKVEKEIREKNKDITNSITYAMQIQQAMLPRKDELKKVIPHSFIHFKPKDIISGDFYWFSKEESGGFRSYGKIVIAAVDCTGHGVPGAFMSIIGNEILNQVVNVSGITNPAEILHMMDEGIKNALGNGRGKTTLHDGMDIAICSYDMQSHQLEYAGAKRPLYLIRNHPEIPSLEIIYPDNFSIGGKSAEVNDIFTNHVFRLNYGDSFYIFTDGYSDQFGGPGNKKFMSKRFRSMLQGISKFSMEEQASIIESTFSEWKGQNEQVDDILIIGIKAMHSIAEMAVDPEMN